MCKRNTLAILAALLAAAACPAADAAEVELADGRTLDGVLRPVTHGLYLLQADDALYELDGREIGAVDGVPGPPLLADAEPLAFVSSYRIVRPDGDVEVWSSQSQENRTNKLLTWLRWGAAPHELEAYRTMSAFDVYGNRLAHRLEPREGSDVHDVIVDFAVPVMPGESVEISFRTVQKGMAALADGVWTFTFAGDCPEDRLQDLKLRLPDGAEVLSVSPAVRVIEHDGAPLVFWRRYYPEGARFPLTVTYRLGE
jgi:hypothetical protein